MARYKIYIFTGGLELYGPLFGLES